MAATRTSSRRWAAAELGPYASFAGDSSGHTTSTIRITSLATSASVSDQFSDYGVILPAAATAADQHNRYVTSGPDSDGDIAVDRVFSATSVMNSATFEFHGVVKTLTEWDRYFNDALKRIMLPVEFTLSPASVTATRHNLTTGQSWLVNHNWVRQVGWLATNEVRADTDPYDRRAVRGGAYRESGTVYMYHPSKTFQTSDTIYVRAYKPAYSHVLPAAGGSYGSQTTGFAAEADEVPVSDELLGYAALTEYARRAVGLLSGDAAKALREKQAEWASLFTYYYRIEVPRIPLAARSVLRVSIS